jgi:hypothetical protein
MAAYLLTCGCGKTVPVEIGQAGGRVACSCGTQLDVPTLRQLRQLPQATLEQKPSSGSWGTRQGWIAASLIVVAALLAWSAWSWWTGPAQPKFVAADYMASVDKHLKEWTPADSWKRWIEFYRPLAERGLPFFQASNAADIQRQIAHGRFLRRMLWSVAGIFAGAAVAVAFWPQPARLAATRREARRP